MSNSSPGKRLVKPFSIGIPEDDETSFTDGTSPTEPRSPTSPHPLTPFCTNSYEQQPLMIHRPSNTNSEESNTRESPAPEDKSQQYQTIDVYHFGDPAYKNRWTQSSRFSRYESDCTGYDNHFGPAHVACSSITAFKSLQQVTEKAILVNNFNFSNVDNMRFYIKKNITDPEYPELGETLDQLIGDRIACLEKQAKVEEEKEKKKKLKSTQSFFSTVHATEHAPIPRNLISAPHNLEKFETDENKNSLPPSKSLAYLMNTMFRNNTRMESHPLEPNDDGNHEEVGMVVAGSVENATVCRLVIFRFAEATSMEMLFPGIAKVREIFFLVGPVLENTSYIDLGRALASVASNPKAAKTFEKLKSPESITKSIERFLSETAVIAPGRIENRNLVSVDLICKIANMEYDKKDKGAACAVHPTDAEHNGCNNNNEEKSDGGSWLFRGVRADLRNRMKHWKTDITDGLTYAVIPVVLYMFCVTVVPTLTFGAIMGQGTAGLLSVKECLMSQALAGLIWSFLSCQPLLVMSPTGPFLVFEKALYSFCFTIGLDFMEVRLMTGFFVFIIMIVGSAANCAQLIKHVTIYTEDIFCALISCIFFSEVWEFLNHQYQHNPVYSLDYYVTHFCTDMNDCHLANPNSFLVQFILLLLSIGIFHWSRKIGKSSLFRSTFRNFCENFGGIFAVIFVSGFYAWRLNRIPVDMVNIPSSFGDNRKGYGYFIIMKEIPSITAILVSLFAAFLVSVLIFVETEIPEQMALREKRKLKKGGGFHWDLIVVGFTTLVSSVIGLPWMCPAAVQSLAHISSVTEYHKTKPSELKKIKNVIEQRVSGFAVYVLLGLFTCFGHLCPIPSAAVFGVFFYLGIRNLEGNLMILRVQMIMTANKYRDKYKQLQDIPIWTVQLYTLLQVLILVVMFLLKLTLIGSLCFPLYIVVCALIRIHLLPWLHTPEWVEILDREIEASLNEEDAEDFYIDSRIPV